MKDLESPEENPMLHDWEWGEYDEANEEYDDLEEEAALDWLYGAEE